MPYSALRRRAMKRGAVSCSCASCCTGMDYWLAVGMALLFGSTILIRGGNEAYMIVYSDEVDMVREVYPPPRPAWRSCR
jgi:hypothetical protein